MLFHVVPSKVWFKKTLEVINRFYHFIPIQDIERYYFDNYKLTSCCHICFDDGDTTVYENALPVLRSMNLPATIFVSPKIVKEEVNYWFQEKSFYDDTDIKRIIAESHGVRYLDIARYSVGSIFKTMKLKDIQRIIIEMRPRGVHSFISRKNINLTQLYEMQKSNIISFGAHTMNHPILSNESDEDSRIEIETSINELSELINEEVRYFAYPDGTYNISFNEREVNILRENNIKLAFTTENRFIHPSDDPLLVPRNSLSYGNRPFVAMKVLTGSYWERLRSIILMHNTEREEIIKLKQIFRNSCVKD